MPISPYCLPPRMEVLGRRPCHDLEWFSKECLRFGECCQGLDIKLIEGVGHVQGGLNGIGQVCRVVKDACDEVACLKENSQTLLDSHKKGVSFSQKYD
jgi:hypothetical protein